jgi:hypothetical protein
VSGCIEEIVNVDNLLHCQNDSQSERECNILDFRATKNMNFFFKKNSAIV